MKLTGIVKFVESLDRILITKKLRQNLGIVEKDMLEIYVEDGKIIVQKFDTSQAAQVRGGVGTLKRIDDGGRIVIPKEICNSLGIKLGTPIEFFIDGTRLILGIYSPGCCFCDEIEDLVTYKGKKVCKACIRDIVKFLDD